MAERLVAQADGGPEETYRLTHDLLRQVVYDAASHAERERLHRRLVEFCRRGRRPGRGRRACPSPW